MRPLPACATLLALFAHASVVRAADIQVNSTVDDLTSPGCSLRAAVFAANDDRPNGGCSAGSGADRILIPAGTYRLSMPPVGQAADDDYNNGGDIDLRGDLELVGAGADRVSIVAVGYNGLHVASTANVTVRGVTLTTSGEGGTSQHQRLLDTPLTTSTVTVEDCVLANTTGAGYALHNGGALTVERTLFRTREGAIEAVLAGSAPVSIRNSTFSGCYACVSVTTFGALTDVDHCTFAGQGAFSTQGIALEVSGIAGNMLRLSNSVFADGYGSVGSQGVASLGGNVFESGFDAYAGDDDRVVDAIALSVLGDHGGPTHTFMPAADSTALSFGRCAGLTVDQRGFARPVDGCTSGAVQVPRCGDGVVTEAEQCEDGPCCDPTTCAFAEGRACGANTDPCAGSDVCDAQGACVRVIPAQLPAVCEEPTAPTAPVERDAGAAPSEEAGEETDAGGMEAESDAGDDVVAAPPGEGKPEHASSGCSVGAGRGHHAWSWSALLVALGLLARRRSRYTVEGIAMRARALDDWLFR